jgi:serine/threonine-protein kinase
VAVAALGVGAYAALHKKPAAPEAAPAAIVAPANPAPPPAALVHFSLRATPDEAKVFLDDVPLNGNPATGSFVKDGASHRIRVEAPGYVAKRDFVVFDTGNVTMDVALDREKPLAVGAVRAGQGAGGKRPTTGGAASVSQGVADPPPAPPPAATPAPTAEPKKPVIDTSDPWAKKTP